MKFKILFDLNFYNELLICDNYLNDRLLFIYITNTNLFYIFLIK